MREGSLEGARGVAVETRSVSWPRRLARHFPFERVNWITSWLSSSHARKENDGRDGAAKRQILFRLPHPSLLLENPHASALTTGAGLIGQPTDKKENHLQL